MNIHGESRPGLYYEKQNNSYIDGIDLRKSGFGNIKRCIVFVWGYEGNLADTTKIKGISDTSSQVQINGNTEVDLKAENTGEAGEE